MLVGSGSYIGVTAINVGLCFVLLIECFTL